MSHYIEYNNNQAGGGHIKKYNRFGKVYVGSYQHGHGIGAFLGGLFRRVVPFLGKALRAIGKEAFHAGANVLSDFTAGQIHFKQSLEHRLTESGLRLKRKASEKLDEIMRGSGYKRKHIRKITHKATRSSRVKKRNTKKKTTIKRKSKINKKKKSTKKTRKVKILERNVTRTIYLIKNVVFTFTFG